MWYQKTKSGGRGCPISSSCPWSQSLDRCLRSPIRHRAERRVTFREPDVELGPRESPCRGPWGHSFGKPLEDRDGALPFCPKVGNSTSPRGAPSLPKCWRWGDYLPEPSVRNVDAWLDWQACQSDMVYWWVELTAIPDVENLKKLAQKIWTSFLSWWLDVKLSQGKNTLHLCPKMFHQEYVPPQLPILSGHSTAAFAADCGLWPSAAVLGGEI